MNKDRMKPRISVLTLGVTDLEKAVAFYRDGLGLATKGIIGKEFEYGAVAFFDLQSGVRLALWPRKSIANDTGIPLQNISSLEFTIGHNVSSKEEVPWEPKNALWKYLIGIDIEPLTENDGFDLSTLFEAFAASQAMS